MTIESNPALTADILASTGSEFTLTGKGNMSDIAVENRVFMEQTITRKGAFEAAHRVMNHCGKCRNLHGHSYHYELSLSFVPKDIPVSGYSIDFAVVKSLYESFIDKYFDHSAILNPADKELIAIASKTNWQEKLFIMPPMNGDPDFCEPSVENVAQLILGALLKIALMTNQSALPFTLTLYETAKSYTTVKLTTAHFNGFSYLGDHLNKLVEEYVLSLHT